MPVLDASYSRFDAADVHLLPGMDAPQLNQLLFYTLAGTPPRTVRGDSGGTGLTVTYTAKLRDTPAGHGIDLTEATGQLSMLLPAPPPGLRSFILTATGTEGTRTSFRMPTRVHVHEEIQQLWLTPDPVTLHRAADGIRLSVMARFTDGVIGDVTNWGALKRPLSTDDLTFARVHGTRDRWLTWRTTGALAVDPDTGVLTTTASSGQGTITVEAGPLRTSATTATATVNIVAGWGDAPVALTPVGSSTFATMTQRTNVLILPDGFVDGEQKKFENLVAEMVGMLGVEPHTRPYDLLQKRMNFFTAWVASPKPGVSVLNAVRHGTRASEGQEVRFPAPKAGSAPVWSLARLVGEVGFPAPFRDEPGSPLGTTTEGRLRNWRLRFGTHIDATVVSEDLHKQWLALSDRVLVDEVDSAFHMAYGARPGLSDRTKVRTVALNPLRVSSDDFDTFLASLHAPPPAALGRWVRGGPDAGNVVVIVRSRRHGAVNSPREDKARVVGMGLGTSNRHQLATVGQRGVAVAPETVPAHASPWSWVTLAHELGHSFGLLDEYAEDNRVAQPGVAASIVAAGNVQARDSLLVEPTPGTKTLDSVAIKWRWPRVESCGVLREPPVPQMADGSDAPAGTVPDRYLLKLQIGHVASPDGSTRHFADNDVVRLRTRPLPTSKTSGQVRVAHADPFDSTLTVVALTGQSLPPDLATRFPTPAGTESLVLRPRRAPGGGREEEMVSEEVVNMIHGSHNPLNAAPNAAPDRPWAAETIDFFKPTPAPDLAPAFMRPHGPRYTSWIVGLFEEGAAAERDVYRPTGVCIMRRSFIQRPVDGEPTVAKDLAYELCPVCRYVLVDRLDPTLHGAIDRDYEKRYYRL
jgi:hypothetical protein